MKLLFLCCQFDSVRPTLSEQLVKGDQRKWKIINASSSGAEFLGTELTNRSRKVIFMNKFNESHVNNQ